jgi:deferrochelatase/peroxidase EfeB
MPEQTGTQAPQSAGITRRQALGGAVLFGAGAATGGLIAGSSEAASAEPQQEKVAFYGRHQAGITTAAQEYLAFAALDTEPSATTSDLRALLETWSRAAATITAGAPYRPAREVPGAAPIDGGEALERGPARLTVTIGFGPGLFESGRFKLAAQGPELQQLPTFVGERLEGARSGGELCVQACADDPQVAFHAIHLLSRLAAGTASLRWTQLGFGRTSSTTAAQLTPRNLMGFKDGTENIRAEDAAQLRSSVWVGSETPSWMRGGTYLVARRIAIKLPGWDQLPLEAQEKVIGRHKQSGAPLGASKEFDPLPLEKKNASGEHVIPENAHVRLAAAATNGGIRILRRGYSYSEPTVGGAPISAGLFFVSFQRSPIDQLIPMLTRLSNFDLLNGHTEHTSSAVFAVPPGAKPGGFVGEGLFA